MKLIKTTEEFTLNPRVWNDLIKFSISLSSRYLSTQTTQITATLTQTAK